MSRAIVDLGGRPVGAWQPCLVIAEVGVNHQGSLPMARRLVDAAAAAGADAVKFQTFDADRVASALAPKAAYQERATGADESQRDMIRRLELAPSAFLELRDRCRDRGVMFLSTPADEPSVDLLDALDVPAFKIGSGEITNLPLLTHVASKGRPILLSTGMSTLDEVADALAALRAGAECDVVLLHCVTSYPAAPEECNLRAIQSLAEEFSLPVGFSDHTLDTHLAAAAVALGAAVIEKHFTLDRGLEGPDHAASVVPDEFATMVRGIRATEAALGNGCKEPTPGERMIAQVARRSLVAARALPAGTILTEDMIMVLRPGTGLPPAALPAVLGQRTRAAVDAGAVLVPELLG